MRIRRYPFSLAVALTMSILLTLLLTQGAESAEDPRMRRPAVIVANVCTPNIGSRPQYCRELEVAGPQMIELYGTIENPVTTEWSMTLRSCNDLLATSIRFAEVLAKLATMITAEDRVDGLRCKLADEQSV